MSDSDSGAADKHPLILLPGLLNDERLWTAQRAALADRAEIHVPDLTRHESIGAMADAVLAEAPERFALAGLSMGGYVALAIMRQAPERVTGLALIDTSAAPDSEEGARARRGMIDQAQHDFDGVIDTLLGKLLHERHQSDRALTASVRAMAHAVGVEGFRLQQQAIMARADSWPTLATIDCPVAVICGREDGITPPEDHQRMAEALADAQYTVIDQCGHLAPLEQPDRVNEALLAWWSRLPGA
ncbi:pimeloyl-ACP methyl ester carboxylesterase [Kushneria sinocarnis]|uniref:Pimeloyl-ACP methyl ester carboxylesterase n=1 Tax=Kushneria sinocarnis TaxID=595502 RepID=A0A420X019_9GAMM|nr:alpha/beta fold hydrolase [Kushneria sinocarnis]RKR06809.1 pimeloyl-ACP methyl ester carboxylesterase [Kushneria sinocarnis]